MSNVKIMPAAFINGRPYKTAKMAATIFAEGVANRQFDRRSKKIGHAAHHDTEWWERHLKGMTLSTYGRLTFRKGKSDKERKAYRRALPIFQRYLP